VGLSLRKLEDAGLDRCAARITREGLRVSNIVECGWLEPLRTETWVAVQRRWIRAAEALAELAPWFLVLTTGPAWTAPWDDAAARLADALVPVREACDRRGITVALENTGPLRVDLSFALTLRDTVDLAAAVGTGVCAELASCWAERALAATFARAGPRLAHAQVSDVCVGSLCTPDRVVPGDGDVPLRRILLDLDRAGYGGAFELELVGPRIDAEGYAHALRRSIASLDGLLGDVAPIG
jgi:sugar phosphate isomerase/epimerase